MCPCFFLLLVLLVDPLGNFPMVAVGSANFSTPSMNQNDEHMLIIRNDQRVADIYLTEFMRLPAHYAFRESVARWTRSGRSAKQWQPNYPAADASW